MSVDRIYYRPPIDVGNCDHCGKPLVATARRYGNGVELSGLGDYDYRHADGTSECVIVRSPRPFSDWQATRKVEEELARRNREYDVLLDLAESVIDSRDVDDWLRAANPQLGGDSPGGCLNDGRHDEVRDLLEAMAEGVVT